MIYAMIYHLFKNYLILQVEFCHCADFVFAVFNNGFYFVQDSARDYDSQDRRKLLTLITLDYSVYLIINWF